MMIKADDIDLTPDFQRHLVWDDFRQSRLIESILVSYSSSNILFCSG